MAFGNGASNVERRKTSHINDNFRAFLKTEVSRVLGIEVNERQAMTMFKVLMKSPLRFLVTLGKEDYDQNEERSLAVTGVGRFKIIDTVAQGKRQSLVGDKPYPRYKFYPSTIIEHEVEILNGLESEEGRVVYDRTIKSEDYNIDLSIKELAKLLNNTEDLKVEVPKTPYQKVGETFTSMIQDIVKNTLEQHLSDYIEIEEVEEEVKDVEVKDVEVKDVEVKDVEVKDVEVKDVEAKDVEPKEEVVVEAKADSTDVTTVANALDNLDFDFT